MKKICLLLFLLFFFAFAPQRSYSQTESSTPTSSPDDIPVVNADTGRAGDFNNFELDPPQFPSDDNDTNYITDFTTKVTVTFPDLPSGKYKICLNNFYCIKSSSFASLGSDKLVNLVTNIGLEENELSGLKDFEGNTITVCGDGKNKLKTDCQEGRDYFHAGNFYLITVYDKSDKMLAVARAGFYVSHGQPNVTLTPSSGLTPGQKFQISISQNSIRAGKNRNNYQVVLEAPGYKDEQCGDVKEGKPLVLNFPQPGDSEAVENGFTIPGKYLFKINEKNNEGGIRGAKDKCKGGFTYMHITCTIGTDPKKNNCKKIIDPKGEDGKELLNLLNIINGEGEQGVPLPCNKKNPFVKNPLECDSIDTSIGPIAVDPVGFITRIFSLVLAFAGLGAMIMIIFSGYKLLISRGNKEIIQGARETLTSAIIGLFFIIFSFVILSFIAGDILKIPGFK